MVRWNFGDTTWGNVYLACLADILHVLDSGVFVHMMDEYLSPLGKVEIRILERLMELLPVTFPDQASKWEIPKIHMIKHLLENVEARGMPHHYNTEMWERTHKGTVKGPVRGSNWADIPQRIVDEEMQYEIYREVAADAGGGRQYVSAMRVAVEELAPVLTKKYRIMRLGCSGDSVFAEYAAVHGDQMVGLPGQLRQMQMACDSVQVIERVHRVLSDGVQLSRERKTVVFTSSTAHRITANDAKTTVEHGLTVVHFTYTRFVDLTDIVQWSSMPFLHGMVDAFKAEYRVILMRRAVRSNIFHEDFDAPFSVVNYAVMLLWMGLAWKALTAATMQRSWWRAGCVPESWWPLMWHLHGMYSAGMYEPLVSTMGDLLVLLREFRVRPALYMTASDYVTCDEWLMEQAGVKLVTPTTPTSSGDEGEMCLPDGPRMRDEQSRWRAIRNVMHAYVCHAEALGIAPAEVVPVVGASNGEVVSRLNRTPKKRARSSGSSDSASV
ncbi:unnamed protein product [Closterium sp. NIES-64]|nr:unnamed protein product [Closterium sp. NIES-64]